MGVYYILYDLFSEWLYGASAVLTGDQTLTLTLLCTVIALAFLLLPFFVVGFLIWIWINLFRR